MTAVIALAAELLGRMLDPAGDPADNSSRSLRFATLLERDPQLARQLTDPELNGDDVVDAPLSVWAWWLDWRRQRSSAPPPKAFLTSLFHASSDPLIRLRIVQSETWHPQWIARYQDSAARQPWRLDAVPVGFVGDGIRRVVLRQFDGYDHRRVEEAVPEPPLELDELATHLLQLGDRWSLAVLEATLNVRWGGQAQLNERFGAPLRAAQDETEFDH